jgi:hypothetical protein
MARTKGSKTTNPNARKTGPKPKTKPNDHIMPLRQTTLSFKTKDADGEEAGDLEQPRQVAASAQDVAGLMLAITNYDEHDDLGNYRTSTNTSESVSFSRSCTSRNPDSWCWWL